MINRAFYKLLHAPKDERGKRKWSVEKVAGAIYCSRQYVQDVLNQRTSHGRLVRRKLVTFFQKEFPTNWRELVTALGWDEAGTVLPLRRGDTDE